MKNIVVKISDLKEIAEFKSFFTPQSNEDLVESYETYGQMVPIHISEDLEIINGYRMVDAIKAAGGETVIAQVLEGKPTLQQRIILNMYRQKTTEDEIRIIKVVFKMFPSRQGKKVEDGKPYERSKKISAALNGRWKNDVIQNKLEYILNNDLENDILSKGIIEKGWKIDTCYEFLKEKQSVDFEKNYGFTEKLKQGECTVAEVNKFIDQRLVMEEKHQHTFTIPEKANFYNMDCVKLADMPNYTGQVNLLTTSIPYWDLRNYAVGQVRQLGQEETKEEYAANIAAIFDKLFPILKESANVIINIGETYRNGVAQGIPFLIKEYVEKNTPLIYKDTLIWSKKNPKPQNEEIKRPINSIEYLLWFVVDPAKAKYNMLTFPDDNKIIKIGGCVKDVRSDGKVAKRNRSISKPYGKMLSHIEEQKVENIVITSIGKNHDIFKISEEGHPAAMSPMLPVTLTLMLSDEHDLVCDPFGGSNVVGKCAIELNRRYLGAELSKTYFNIGCEMLELGNQNFNREELDQINEMVYDQQIGIDKFNELFETKTPASKELVQPIKINLLGRVGDYQFYNYEEAA
jgi:DNA modification methylase